MKSKKYTILAINPGSTSTKLAVFQDEKEVAATDISHPAEEIAKFQQVIEQQDMRYLHVRQFLDESGFTLSAVVGRGGILHPIPSGVYHVNQAMIDDLRAGRYGEHASNLGAIIALKIAEPLGLPSYIVDPVVVDEMDDVARITGHPDMRRLSRFHALNQKSSARAAAKKLGKPYEELNLIVAHLGGGISVGAHRKGRVVDVNNALYGDGPFSPERCGTTPIEDLVSLCFSGAKKRDILKQMAGRGGMVAHLGTNDLRVAKEQVAAGNEQAKLVVDALVYQVAKEIASHGATLKGKVNGIVITGGMARDKELVRQLRQRVGYLAKLIVIPGEREMEALAQGVLAVLRGERKAKTYEAY